MTVDFGATFISLFNYLTLVGVLVVAAAVSADRTRAEWLLFSLIGATTLSALALLAHDLPGVSPVGEATVGGLQAATVVGMIAATSGSVRSIERYESRGRRNKMTWTMFARSLVFSLSAFALCAIATLIAAPPQLMFAGICGVVVVALVAAIRRLSL